MTQRTDFRRLFNALTPSNDRGVGHTYALIYSAIGAGLQGGSVVYLTYSFGTDPYYLRSEVDHIVQELMGGGIKTGSGDRSSIRYLSITIPANQTFELGIVCRDNIPMMRSIGASGIQFHDNSQKE